VSPGAARRARANPGLHSDGQNRCPHFGQALDAARPEALAALNRELDRQVASFGIHPGREGLGELELLAAMKLLE
jgi:hypothetical protein